MAGAGAELRQSQGGPEEPIEPHRLTRGLAATSAKSKSARFSRTVDALIAESNGVGLAEAEAASGEAALRSLPRRPGAGDLGTAVRPMAGDSLRLGPRPLLPSSRIGG